MRKVLLSSLAMLAVCGSALAADLPARTYEKAPAPVVVDPATNWSGFYIGVMGGYGWSQQLRATVGGVAFAGTSSDLNGGFGGGTIGYNWQSGSFVFGLEGDGAWSGMRWSQTAAGVTVADKLQAFGSVTGRAGFAVNNALFYAKGGYAWANNQISASGFGVTLSESHYHSGWTVGAGLEYMFLPQWSGKLEYMYADYRNATYLAAFAPGGIGLGMTTHTVKGGINWHFGGPVVARY